MEILLLVGLVIIAFVAIPKIIRKKKNAIHREEAIATLKNLSYFNATKYYLSSNSGVSVGIDYNKKLICFLDKQNNPLILTFDKILTCELIVNGKSVFKSSTPEVIGRSIIGNVLGKEAGTIVGGVTSSVTTMDIIQNIRLKVIVSNTDNPFYYIDFLESKTERNSYKFNTAYSIAEKWHALFFGILKEN